MMLDMRTPEEIKVAIFQEFMDKLETGVELTDTWVPVKEIQNNVAEKLGVQWTDVQKVTRSMKHSNFLSSKKGLQRSWLFAPTEVFIEWFVSDERDGLANLDPVMVTYKVPQLTWNKYLKAFRDGNFYIAFVPAGTKLVAYRERGTDKTVQVKKWKP